MLMAKSNGEAKPETLADGTELAQIDPLLYFISAKSVKQLSLSTIEPHY